MANPSISPWQRTVSSKENAQDQARAFSEVLVTGSGPVPNHCLPYF